MVSYGINDPLIVDLPLIYLSKNHKILRSSATWTFQRHRQQAAGPRIQPRDACGVAWLQALLQRCQPGATVQVKGPFHG